MLDKPQFIQTDEQLAVVIHLIIPRAEISLAINSAIAEILMFSKLKTLPQSGRCFHITRKSHPIFLISSWASLSANPSHPLDA